MDNSEEILRQAIKSAQFPELSNGFTSKVMEEINLLPKPKPVIAKPLINPYILWSGIVVILLITFILGLNSKKVELNYLNFQNLTPVVDFIKHITSNYLVTAYASLILFWFLIDYKLIGRGKGKLFFRKISLK